MDNYKRVKDLSQVFDEIWKPNHNYEEIKKNKEQAKNHFNKMYNIQDRNERRKEILRANSVEGRINTLNQKIDGAVNAERINRMNNFKNNFR